MTEPLDKSVNDCSCNRPPFNSANFEINFRGIDQTLSRYGEVRLMKCTICGQCWIEYFYENEAFSQSGRWFKGRITEALGKIIKPEEVVPYLEQLNEFYCGGSFFRTPGKLTKGKLHI